MQLHTLFRALVAATLCAALALLAPPTQAQHADPAPAQAAQRLFLPLIGQPEVLPTAIRFGTGIVDAALVGAATSFAAGRTTLFYEVAVAGGAGRTLRLEWTINGVRQPGLDRTVTLAADGAPFLGGIGLSSGAPLPIGNYELRAFVSGALAGQGQARIEQG